jgi:hypothetical protein
MTGTSTQKGAMPVPLLKSKRLNQIRLSLDGESFEILTLFEECISNLLMRKDLSSVRRADATRAERARIGDAAFERGGR